MLFVEDAFVVISSSASGNFPTSYVRNDVSSRSFMAVPFGIAKDWKQLKYPLRWEY